MDHMSRAVLLETKSDDDFLALLNLFDNLEAKHQDMIGLLKSVLVYLKEHTIQLSECSEKKTSHEKFRIIPFKIYTCGKMPSFQGREDIGYNSCDFETSTEAYILAMQCFRELFSCYEQFDEDFKSCLTIYGFLLSCEHTQCDLWTTASSIGLAHQIQNEILAVNGVSLQELLQGTQKQPGKLKDILLLVIQQFTRHNWKENPAVKQVYTWSLVHVVSPHLSDHLDLIMPPMLLLLDDHELDNKLRGIRCLSHILENTSASELFWYGRAHVIYEILSKLTYTNEPQLVEALHPPLITILSILHKFSSDEKKQDFSVFDAQDQTFIQFLTNMQMESNILMRHAYSKHLALYIDALGIRSIMHLNLLLSVISNYLDVFDGPEEKCRLNVLRALKLTISVCWPRIPNQCENLLKVIWRFMHDLGNDHDITPFTTKTDLLEICKECLALLNKLCPEKTTTALAEIRGVGLGDKLELQIERSFQ